MQPKYLVAKVPISSQNLLVLEKKPLKQRSQDKTYGNLKPTNSSSFQLQKVQAHFLNRYRAFFHYWKVYKGIVNYLWWHISLLSTNPAATGKEISLVMYIFCNSRFWWHYYEYYSHVLKLLNKLLLVKQLLSMAVHIPFKVCWHFKWTSFKTNQFEIDLKNMYFCIFDYCFSFLLKQGVPLPFFTFWERPALKLST